MVNQVVVPDADGQYVWPVQVNQFFSDSLAVTGTFTVQYWDFAFKREAIPIWTPVTNFTTMYPYNGSGTNFGVHVVSVSGQDRVEFSNVSGLSYLPGNLPFSIAPP